MTNSKEEKNTFIKSIPILSLVLAVFLQTGAAMYWAGTISNKIDNVNHTVTELKTERYTSNDAKRDFALQNLKAESLERRLNKLESQVDNLKK